MQAGPYLMIVYSHNKLIDVHRCDMEFVLKITLTVITIKKCNNIVKMGVPGFTTDCPYGVWCRGLTTCLLCVGSPFGNLVWDDIGFVIWHNREQHLQCFNCVLLTSECLTISYFHLPYFHGSNSALFLHSTLVRFFYLDVNLTLSNRSDCPHHNRIIDIKSKSYLPPTPDNLGYLMHIMLVTCNAIIIS